MPATNKKTLSAEDQTALLTTLQARFEKHPQRHKGVKWENVLAKLEASPAALSCLQKMEHSGGEPDVVGKVTAHGEYTFMDCSAESPSGRRSLCYDAAAWKSRKEARPDGSAQDVAAEMGIRLLTEEEYRLLQTFGEFDVKTSSWIETPDAIRALGGALFCDRRYNHVFLYHNGAQSYYAARGFRGALVVQSESEPGAHVFAYAVATSLAVDITLRR